MTTLTNTYTTDTVTLTDTNPTISININKDKAIELTPDMVDSMIAQLEQMRDNKSLPYSDLISNY